MTKIDKPGARQPTAVDDPVVRSIRDINYRPALDPRHPVLVLAS